MKTGQIESVITSRIERRLPVSSSSSRRAHSSTSSPGNRAPDEHRPRKRLGFRKPIEEIAELLAA
jgi:hypothetical protein